MAYAELNGTRVLKGEINFPFFGIWHADVVLVQDLDIPTGPRAITLTVGNLTMLGTVFRTSSFAGSRGVRVIGGAGGWRQTIPARGYNMPGGVPFSMVVTDAATESQELITVNSTATIGDKFVRVSAPAGRVLNLVGNPLWWVRPKDGVTTFETRDNSSISSQFNVIHFHGAPGRFQIATEDIASWQPNRHFSSSFNSDKEIACVTHVIEKDGKVRSYVLAP